MVKKNKSFEDSLQELEEIVGDLEEGNLPLKESVKKFKKGAELLKKCKKELEEAEMTIHKMVDEDGKINLEEFE